MDENVINNFFLYKQQFLLDLHRNVLTIYLNKKGQCNTEELNVTTKTPPGHWRLPIRRPLLGITKNTKKSGYLRYS